MSGMSALSTCARTPGSSLGVAAGRRSIQQAGVRRSSSSSNRREQPPRVHPSSTTNAASVRFLQSASRRQLHSTSGRQAASSGTDRSDGRPQLVPARSSTNSPSGTTSAASDPALSSSPPPPSVPKLSRPEELARTLADLRTLLLESTGVQAHRANNEAVSTTEPGPSSLPVRHIAFPAYQGGREEEEAWLQRLDESIASLNRVASGSKTTRITVLGTSHEELAEFTFALLEDPLATDTRAYDLLQRRAADVRRSALTTGPSTSALPSPTRIRSGPSSTGGSSGDVQIPSQWLSELNAEVVELVLPSGPGSHLGSQSWTELLKADIVIALSPPTQRADLARLTRKPNVIFAQSPKEVPPLSKLLVPASEGARGRADPASGHVDKQAISPPVKRMVLDAAAAIQANEIFRQGESTIQSDFSSLLLRSGIPQLREVLEGLCQPHSEQARGSQPTAAGSQIQVETAAHTAADLLLSLSSSLAETRTFLFSASAQLGQLDLRAARDKRHSEIELGFTDLGKLDLELLVTDNPAKAEGQTHSAAKKQVDNAAQKTEANSVPGNAVDAMGTQEVEDVQLLEDGRKDVEKALEAKRLRWHKLPFGRADDIATDLSNGLAGYFGDLERKLIFETGRLSERSLALSAYIDSFFQSPQPFSPRPKDSLSLYSATVQNTLSSLSPTTQFGFPPPAHPSPLNLRQTSLTLPITSRKAQLCAAGGPIEKLQLRAQSAVVQFYGVAGGSTAISVFLAQTPMPELATDLPTAVGVGLLGTVLAGWRLQGAWKKAKAKFWTDWKRAQEGLSYDLQENARSVLDKQVFKKPDVARKLLRQQLKIREDGLKRLEADLRTYHKRISA